MQRAIPRCFLKTRGRDGGAAVGGPCRPDALAGRLCRDQPAAPLPPDFRTALRAGAFFAARLGGVFRAGLFAVGALLGGVLRAAVFAGAAAFFAGALVAARLAVRFAAFFVAPAGALAAGLASRAGAVRAAVRRAGFRVLSLAAG